MADYEKVCQIVSYEQIKQLFSKNLPENRINSENPQGSNIENPILEQPEDEVEKWFGIFCPKNNSTGFCEGNTIKFFVEGISPPCKAIF